MTRSGTDFGARSRMGRGRGGAIAAMMVVAAIGISAALFGPAFTRHQRQAVETAKAWTVEGPPCQALSAAAARSYMFQTRKTFEFDGVTFARAAGDASCQEVGYDGGRSLRTYVVCKFTSPQVIRVSSKAGEFIFAPGAGKPATVATPHGQASCVAAANPDD